jgi:hypothetical protein
MSPTDPPPSARSSHRETLRIAATHGFALNQTRNGTAARATCRTACAWAGAARAPPRRGRASVGGRAGAGRPGVVPFQSQRLQSTGLAEGVEPEEPRLRHGRRRSEQPRPTHRPQLPGLRLDPHLVAREQFPRVLQSDALGRKPQCRLPARQGLLAVEAPVPKTRVPEGVQGA